MNKKAFSLFELVLVVVIIGFVYSLVLGKINSKKNIHIQRLENLRQLLPKGSELIVFDRCSKVVLKNSSKNINSNIFHDIQVFTVENDNLKEIDFSPFKDKENLYDVCLRFKIFDNGSCSSYIIKQNDNYIVFHPYFKKTEIYHDKDKAISAFLESDVLEEYKNEI